LIVLIPAYNPPDGLGDLVKRCFQTGYPESVLVIDDGSVYGDFQQVPGAGGLVKRHNMYLGKGAAIRTGFSFALKNGFDVVITLDADGQHAPESIPLFVKKYDESDCHFIVGNRMENPAGMPLMRQFTNRTTSKILSRITGQVIEDSQCGYRLISSKVLSGLNLETNRYETESEILIKASIAGFRICSVPIPTIYSGNKSFINPLRDTWRFVRMIRLSENWVK